MKTLDDLSQHKKFLDLTREAHTNLFQKLGESSPEGILSQVIDADPALWKAMQPQFAKQGAMVLIKTTIKRMPHAIDAGKQLALFPDMPRFIPFKRRKINLMKADASQLEWYADWWKRRLEGVAKRTESDLAIEAQIDRARRLIKKYDPSGNLESALRIRDERLEAARRLREKRRARRS